MIFMETKIDNLLDKALLDKQLTLEEGIFLYKNSPLQKLIIVADKIRQKKVDNPNEVGWIIDRNINLSNICTTFCGFCNFCRTKNSEEAYITTMEEYKQKIDELYALGGRQILLQGGMNPEFNLSWYKKLFENLKKLYPDLKIHALGPAEIHYIAKQENLSYREVLKSLKESGLESLPGAGAEILVDRVRKLVSPAKCTASQWLEVMHAAHQENLATSATMMFGHLETIEERIEHLIKIREVQDRKPKNSKGFVSFIPWPFWSKGTRLEKKYGKFSQITAWEYLRLIAISRIMLNNIKNIQASWLTVGQGVGQVCLNSGANDFGSIMMEENVVSKAGAKYQLDIQNMKNAIRNAGFEPKLRLCIDELA